jgi:hypothetical protein
MPTEQYKVLEGKYYGIADPTKKFHDPKRLGKHVKGDIVVSDQPLDEMFVNKFEKLIPGVSAPIIVTPERKAAVDRVIEAGPWGDEDRNMLEELPEVAFTRITAVVGDKASKGKSATGTDEKKATSPLGDDVTDTYGTAYDNNLKVFRNPKGQLNITKANNWKKPVNKEPLEPAQVEGWIAQYLKDMQNG